MSRSIKPPKFPEQPHALRGALAFKNIQPLKRPKQKRGSRMFTYIRRVYMRTIQAEAERLNDENGEISKKIHFW